jgi:hypothetical protein
VWAVADLGTTGHGNWPGFTVERGLNTSCPGEERKCRGVEEHDFLRLQHLPAGRDILLSDPERRARLIPGSLEGVPTFTLLVWSFFLELVGPLHDISESQAIFVQELRIKRLLSILTPCVFIGYHIIRKF